MNSIWKNRLLMGVVVAIAIIVVVSFFRPAQAFMGEEEVRQLVVDQYGGEILSFTETEEFGQTVYQIQLATDRNQYEVMVDPYTGDILSLSLSSGNIEVDHDNSKDRVDENLLTHSEIRNILQSELGEEATILELQLTEQDGVSVYDVLFRQGQAEGEVTIHAQTGEILFYAVHDETRHAPVQPKQLIGEEEAIRIALSHVEGVVDDIDLEEENGRLFYEIEIELTSEDSEADVLIDAITGEVIAIIWED
ncbi:PepSY domain-containing protein [Alkalihalobacillus sp. MEB130]|uniref:PepSY domain-containing protein n=1 Tax=Alkalihalobacillus sp. MEB130 TaxID=2976704 RepID=UPI0028DFB2C5|nr:PepSY domain-containing protein [Alkalihalobacillus sp. MEB130]MDT8859745.1 PepSY domain-containing protein [Alkalihalobacillus sp. MEB130]